MSVEIKKGQTVCLKIERIGVNGEGIGYINGLITFVMNMLIGEVGHVEIIEVKANYAKAQLKELTEESPHRISPPCPYYLECGGCQLMHLSYEEQLQYKYDRVLGAIKHIGKQENIPIKPIIASPDIYHYRNKVQFPVQHQKNKITLGLYQLNSHKLIPITECLLQPPSSNDLLIPLQELLRQHNISAYNEANHQGILRHIIIRSNTNGELMLILVTNGRFSEIIKSLGLAIRNAFPTIVTLIQNINDQKGNVILSNRSITIYGKGTIDQELMGIKFRLGATSFFQINHQQTINLYQKAIEIAKLKSSERVIDAYCGVGTLSLLIGKTCQQVTGVEIVPEAVRDAIFNAKVNQIKHVEFVCAKAEDFLETAPTFDCLFVDPPRKGCDLQFINSVIKHSPRKIVYISCHPESLARDIFLLIQGGYQLKEVTPVDMFPHTSHVESVALLEHLPYLDPQEQTHIG